MKPVTVIMNHAMKAIKSCETFAQLYTAQNYMNLAINHGFDVHTYKNSDVDDWQAYLNEIWVTQHGKINEKMK